MTTPKPDEVVARPVPTQVARPWRATLRTLYAYVTAVLVLLAFGLPVLVDELGPRLAGQIASLALLVAGIAAGILTTIQRIMLIPAVNDALTRAGLGPTPKP